jgi:hypothetical protein
MELVIQYVSMIVLNLVPVHSGEFFSQVGGAGAINYLLLAQQSSTTSVASQPLTQYSDPGTQAGCSFQATSSNPSAYLGARLVDIPSACRKRGEYRPSAETRRDSPWRWALYGNKLGRVGGNEEKKLNLGGKK